MMSLYCCINNAGERLESSAETQPASGGKVYQQDSRS